MVNRHDEQLVLVNKGLADLEAVVHEIYGFSRGIRLWLLSGELGAGKTTFLQSVANVFSIKDAVSSPTFGLVNEYSNDRNEVFYHFDFYRIDNIREVIDIGFYEYLDSGAYCFIEWPEKIEALLPEKFVLIRIQETTPELRRFEINIYE